MPDISAEVSASLDALTREFDIVTHNLANVSTAGYKRRCSVFTKELDALSQEGTAADDGEPSVFDFSQGQLVHTQRTLDVALHGKGFFVIETPDGPIYTRHGVFRTNQNGQIVDFAGRVVAGLSGPLTVPSVVSVGEVNVANDGQMSAGDAAIGRLRVVAFPEAEDQLIPAGLNGFRAPEGVEPVDADEVVVKQGYQEASNVQMIDELVSMITVTRLYEANMKLLSAAKDTTNSMIAVAVG